MKSQYLSLFVMSSFLMHFAQAGAYSIGEPQITWTKRSVHVCWQDGGNNFENEQKDAVQKIVQKEYRLDRTGIEFIGWENCSELNGNFDLQIFQDNELKPATAAIKPFRDAQVEGFAVLGEGSLEQQDKTLENSGFFNRKLQLSTMYLMYRPIFRIFENHFKSIEELQVTALHEFGHVAGLRHEHIRPEAKTDVNCKLISDVESDSATQRFYTEYDPNSIMNYCWTATLAVNGTVTTKSPNLKDEALYTVSIDKKTHKKTYTIQVGLSTNDVKTLKALYP